MDRADVNGSGHHNHHHHRHRVHEDEPVDGASVASSEDCFNAPPSPCSSTGETKLMNGSLDSTRQKEQTDRFGFTGGKQYTKDPDWHTPVEVIRRREIKWLDMLDDWDKWMSKKPRKVRERCRKGIPGSIRARAWQNLCGSKKLMEQNKRTWQELDESEGDPKWLDIIQRDLDRQFPFHEMFASREGHGQLDLYRILKAYSVYNPRDGYCQAQAPVAAVLLMHMPAEDAFWALVQICEKYLTGYYSPGLEAVQIDGQVLARLTKKETNVTYKHMKQHRIEPILYMTEWFMCIFSRTLPWPSVLRVWDMFFCEGVKVLFRVGLVLLKGTLGRSDQIRACQGLYETMEALKNISQEVLHEDYLVAEMLKLKVFERDMEEEHSLSLARRRIVKERQLAPEKAAAMARDIEMLRKKKRGKVKPPKTRDKTPGFGSQDLLAMDAELNATGSPRDSQSRTSVDSRESERSRSSLSDLPSGRQLKHSFEVHVDNPPKDWVMLDAKETSPEKSAKVKESKSKESKSKESKSKESKSKEKKREKIAQKKGRSPEEDSPVHSPVADASGTVVGASGVVGSGTNVEATATVAAGVAVIAAGAEARVGANAGRTAEVDLRMDPKSRDDKKNIKKIKGVEKKEEKRAKKIEKNEKKLAKKIDKSDKKMPKVDSVERGAYATSSEPSVISSEHNARGPSLHSFHGNEEAAAAVGKPTDNISGSGPDRFPYTHSPDPNPNPTHNPSPSTSPTHNPSPSTSPTHNPSPSTSHNPSPSTSPSHFPSPSPNPNPSHNPNLAASTNDDSFPPNGDNQGMGATVQETNGSSHSPPGSPGKTSPVKQKPSSPKMMSPREVEESMSLIARGLETPV